MAQQIQSGDVFLFNTEDNGDIEVINGITTMRGSLETMIYLALFGGNTNDDGSADSPFTFWGNLGESEPCRKYVSRTQNILQGLPLTLNNLNRVKEAITEDLKCFIDEKIASSVDVEVTIPDVDTIKMSIKITADERETTIEFFENWQRDISANSALEDLDPLELPPPPPSDPAFTITVDTTISGATPSTDFRFMGTGTGAGYDIDWGDTNTDLGQFGNLTHTYSSGGVYTIKVTSELDFVQFVGNLDRNKVLTIENWGAIDWESMDSAFGACINLSAINATDSPNLADAISMNGTFQSCLALTSLDLSSWDVSTITIFSITFKGMTAMTSIDLTGWDTSSATTFSGMFQQSTLLNPDVSGFNISSLTSAPNMFLLSGFDTDNYDLLLVAWEGQSHLNNVTFHAGTAKFNTGAPATAKADLESAPDNWGITDGGPV